MNERLRKLRDEYRPSMGEDVLRAWASDVVAALSDEADGRFRCPGCGAMDEDGLMIHWPDCGWA